MIRTTLLFCTFIAISIVTQAQVYKTDSGTAVFISKVPLHSFEGKSSYLNGAINLSSKIVDFYIDLETLDTGNGKRDKDMRLTLETKTFPFAEFYGKLVSNFDSTSTLIQPVKVEGFFRVHGKENAVSIEGTLQKIGKELALKASWILNLIDYDIVPPSLLILKVDEEQVIEISAILYKQTN